MSAPYDAIVLAGGAARRLGGVDKPALLLDGRTLLDHVLDSCPDAQRHIVVGPQRSTRRVVRWCREDPPGGGPVPALAAGLQLAEAPVVLVLAADMPFVGPAIAGLVAALDGRDGALLVDAGGRDQPLAAAYRTQVLRDRVAAHRGALAGVPMRQLIEGLDCARVVDTAGASVDCDTWADAASAGIGGQGATW
jgi:molybdopterin-guanine dinucleotide biosynthesis protein A